MVIKNVNLETVCGITSVLPKNTKPEIAFAGKSNVGKSSLINALMNRKSYQRLRVRHRRLIIIVLMMKCILLTFRVMDTQKCLNRKKLNGDS